jgi:beta-lactamase regulating signal transducer with metallopeptidase domain
MMLSTLARASVEGGLLVVLIWVAGRMLPRLSPGARTILWWCAAAKFMAALVWVTPIQVPVLPARVEVMPAAAERPAIQGPRLPSREDPDRAADARGPGDADRAGAPSGSSVVEAILVLAWIAGAVASAGIGFRRWRTTTGHVRLAVRAPERIQRIAAEMGDRLGMRRLPELRMSGDIETPIVIGLLRPVVLLPALRFEKLSDRQQRMALCHELAHLQRADLWLGCLPALAERLFFFHPFARLAAREYSFWRESACDLAVLELLDSAPQEYGRLLLDLGVSRREHGLAAAGASWSFSTLKRRLIMLRHPSSRSIGSRLLSATAITCSAVILAGVQLTARPQPSQEPMPILPAWAQIDSKLWSALVEDWIGSGALAPEKGLAPQGEQDLNFVLLMDEHNVNMSGSDADVDRARRLQRSGERLLWFRQGGREFVVRDPATLDQIAALWKPVSVIGEAQGEVGGRQGRLGEEQGRIGERQGKIGEEQGRIGARQGVLGEQQGRLAAEEMATRTDGKAFEERRRQIDMQMRQLDAEMRALDLKMRELEKPMRDLDDQMRVLDKEMQALDGKMRQAVAQAESQMRALLSRAIASGAAEPVP